MIICRRNDISYTEISRKIFQNDDLSARAKGIYAYIISLPDDYKLYKSDLVKHFSEGRDAINNAFKQLEKFGYIKKTAKRLENGRMDGWDYELQF